MSMILLLLYDIIIVIHKVYNKRNFGFYFIYQSVADFYSLVDDIPLSESATET